MPVSSQYLVVKFLVLPYKDIDQYVCVPGSWQRWQDSDGEVAVAYPEENPEVTSVRALSDENCSKRWKIYMAEICYKAGSYEEGIHFIVDNKSDHMYDKLQNMKIENSVKYFNQSISSTPKSNSIKQKMKNNSPCTSTPKTVKKETEEITPSTSTPKTVKKEMEEITPPTSTPKMVKEIKENSKPSPPLTKKFQKNLTEEMNNQETGKVKIEVNITPQNKTKKSPYKIPADFNPADLKDMFRHNSPILGDVVELLPDTGVYIEINVLETKFKDYSDMAEGLMKGIFTNKALRNCTLSGEPPIAKNHQDSDTRPAVDQDAREAIIKYVYEKCYKHWKEGRNNIENAMRKVLINFRAKK